MSQDRELESNPTTKAPAQPLRPEESVNTSGDGSPPLREVPIGEADVVAGGIEYGEMNETDARESGYITDDQSTSH